jgi:regulator of sigma E protease
MGIVLFIIGIILFVSLIALHELGHAIAAKRNGVVVEEFGIGFPPRAWKKKLKNGVLFTLNWLPIGGFVKMQRVKKVIMVQQACGQKQRFYLQV